MKYSKEGQDQFALLCAENAGGFFLDLGAAHPWDGNNTVRLEEMGWTGWRFDINPHVANIHTTRKSPLIIADITTFPWHKPAPYVDYISFDVDEGTVGAIDNFPWDDVRFGCMTFEHDKRSRPECLRQQAMDCALANRGYLCVARDVCYEDGGLHIFEDWWVDPGRTPFTSPVPTGLPWWKVIDTLTARKKTQGAP